MAIIINGSTGISATESSNILPDDSIETNDIQDGAITSAKLADTYLTSIEGFSVTSGTLTTANVTTVDLGNWTITESAGVLYFASSGTNKMKLDASGNLTVVGNVTAYGTV